MKWFKASSYMKSQKQHNIRWILLFLLYHIVFAGVVGHMIFREGEEFWDARAVVFGAYLLLSICVWVLGGLLISLAYKAKGGKRISRYVMIHFLLTAVLCGTLNAVVYVFSYHCSDVLYITSQDMGMLFFLYEAGSLLNSGAVLSRHRGQ